MDHVCKRDAFYLGKKLIFPGSTFDGVRVGSGMVKVVLFVSVIINLKPFLVPQI